MSKNDKAAERRERLEKMRAQEKAQSRRRTLLAVAPAVVLAVVIGVVVFVEVRKQAADPDGNSELAGIGVAASKAGCQDVETEKADGNNDHKDEGQTIDYPQSPPASGPHWGVFLQGNQIRKFWTPDDRPPVERLVHSLEHGHTILWYDETIADDDAELKELEDIAETFEGNDPRNKFMAAPWTAQDVKDRGSDFPEGTHLALTHWTGGDGDPKKQQGVRQFCSKVSGEAVQDFMKDYPYTDAPEAGAA